MSVVELMSLPYPELHGWIDYYSRYPIGWREDYRAYIIAASLAGSDKVKPEDLFQSLAKMKKNQSTEDEKSVQQKGILSFIERFAPRMKGDLSVIGEDAE